MPADSRFATYRAFLEGRAGLETLEADSITRARAVFEDALRNVPDHASAHIGLANACVMQFEMTRTNPAPDTPALDLAAHHAREACRLDSQSGEAWATLGFVLDRTGNHLDAPAAAKRAVTLEPDNWRHHFRLSYVSWGAERLGAAHRTLALLPDFPMAHWLAATVYVARQSLGEAERELTAGLATQAGPPTEGSRFGAVALHWLLGLVHLARGDDARALEAFEDELSLQNTGQLYARECAANTWYAIGALRIRQHRPADAAAAFTRAIHRVPTHPMARVGLVVTGAFDQIAPRPADTRRGDRDRRRSPVDSAVFEAAQLSVAGRPREAALILDEALTIAPAGNAGWILPVEPLLHVTAHPEVWTRALAHLRNRAS